MNHVNICDDLIDDSTTMASEEITKMAYSLSAKISREWWLDAMARFNELPEDKRKECKQFIGFNDFADTLLNRCAEVYIKCATEDLPVDEATLNELAWKEARKRYDTVKKEVNYDFKLDCAECYKAGYNAALKRKPAQ